MSYCLFPQIARPFLQRRKLGLGGKEELAVAIGEALYQQARGQGDQARGRRRPGQGRFHVEDGRPARASRGGGEMANNKFKLTLDGQAYELERREGMMVVNGMEFSFERKENSITVAGSPPRGEAP